MKPLLILIVIESLTAFANVHAADVNTFPTNAPSHLELRDQYNAVRNISFPTTNVTILTIADRKGSEEVDAWIAALKPVYAGRVDFRGLADVAGVPGFLQQRVRRKFQETHKYPVMMDWNGQVCRRLGYSAGKANVLVIDRKGRIRGRFCGEATTLLVKQACLAADEALAIDDEVATQPR